MHRWKTRRLSRFLAISGAVACLIAVTPTGATAQADRDGEVGRVCVSVVGVPVGEKHYVACVESLSQSLQGLREGKNRGMARRGCLTHGYLPDTPGLAECEFATRSASAARGLDASRGPEFPAANPGGSRSYFAVSRETAFQREQLACAKLGFDLAQSPFNDCAADLREALHRASNPAS
jgi:hypothetical protein